MNYLNSSLLGDTKSSVEWGNSHCQTNVDQWRGSGEGLEASSFGEGSLGTIGLRGSELLCPPSRNSKWEDVPFRLPSLSGSWKETDAYSTRIWGKFIEGIIYRGRKCVCVCVCVQSLNHAQLFVTPWLVAHQAPLSLGFPRQEYWRELPFPSPRNLSWPRDQTHISCISKQILYHCVTWEGLAEAWAVLKVPTSNVEVRRVWQH